MISDIVARYQRSYDNETDERLINEVNKLVM